MSTVSQTLRQFAHEHDDIVAFHAIFILLAFLCAALLNLGAFALLIFAHMALDTVKYRERHSCSWRLTLEGVVRESLVDVTLLLVGLVFAVYLHHSVGVASLAGLMRAELTVIRSVAMFVPKVKILHHFLKIMAHLHHYLEQVHPRFRKRWTGLDHLCFYFCGISVLLLVFSSTLMNVDARTVQSILWHELIPWNL